MAVELKFEPTRESLREMKRLERETPRLFRRAYFDGIKRVHNAFKSIMKKQGGHGAPTFAPRQPMTLTLHPGTKPGGVLSDPKRIVIDNLGGDARRVGWVGTLDKWAVKYQTAQAYTFTQNDRHYWRRRRVDPVPATYDRPSRPVVQPLHGYIARHFAVYVLEAYNKRARSLRARGLELK